MTPDRAQEILRTMSPFGELQMSKSEDAEVRKVWQTMPGYTCFYDALVRIARNEIN
jgi:hypothetical protein